MFPEYITPAQRSVGHEAGGRPVGTFAAAQPAHRLDRQGRGEESCITTGSGPAKAGKDPTPAASNLVLDGQENTLEDLIRSTDRGLLITRFWYIRTLQPQTLQVTGLTRDGVFLVENGKVTDPVNNFRWNESPVRVLQNTTKLTHPVRSQGAEGPSTIAPAIVATEFNLASVSDAV